jgi:hypothetical protein
VRPWNDHITNSSNNSSISISNSWTRLPSVRRTLKLLLLVLSSRRQLQTISSHSSKAVPIRVPLALPLLLLRPPSLPLDLLPRHRHQLQVSPLLLLPTLPHLLNLSPLLLLLTLPPLLPHLLLLRQLQLFQLWPQRSQLRPRNPQDNPQDNSRHRHQHQLSQLHLPTLLFLPHRQLRQLLLLLQL